jgi:Patatin-like phospholipase
MQESGLRILAGETAIARLRTCGGFAQDAFDVVAGASGGAKWLMLSRLDQAIFGAWFKERTRPLHMVGSSIGSWRFACLAQANPVAALARFEAAYLDYTIKPGACVADMTADCHDFLDIILQGDATDEIVRHPCMRLCILAVRGRWPIRPDRPLGQAIGLGVAGLANLARRPALRRFFQRTAFHDHRAPLPFDPGLPFPTQQTPLTADNLRPALMASGAVPFVIEGVSNPPGARPGLYMDGGIIDYHLDIEFTPPGLIFYPHFSSRIVPGWYDKRLFWRRPRASSLARTVLLCPSPGFVAKLPYGKIPDRRDFLRLPDAERRRFWRTVIKATEQLADEWHEGLATGSIMDRLELLTGR